MHILSSNRVGGRVSFFQSLLQTCYAVEHQKAKQHVIHQHVIHLFMDIQTHLILRPPQIKDHFHAVPTLNFNVKGVVQIGPHHK